MKVRVRRFNCEEIEINFSIPLVTSATVFQFDAIVISES